MRPRASIARVMAAVVGVAIAAAALRNASGPWASALFTLDLALIAASIVLTIVRPPGKRGFWVGAAVFGAAYLAATFGPWPGRAGVHAPPLITRWILDLAADRVHATEERLVVEGVGAGEILEPPILGLQSGPVRIIYGNGGPDGTRLQVYPAKMPGRSVVQPPIVDAHEYRRVGHGLFALIAWLVGGAIGRVGSRAAAG